MARAATTPNEREAQGRSQAAYRAARKRFDAYLEARLRGRALTEPTGRPNRRQRRAEAARKRGADG